MSGRGAEIALTMARASNAKCTTLVVAGEARPPQVEMDGAPQGDRDPPRHIELADSLNARIKTVTRADEPPDEAITRSEARRHDLIVIGVSRHPGERRFLGELASSILEHNKISVLIVASESYGYKGARAAAAELAQELRACGN